MVVTVYDREKEFAHEGFYVFDKTNKILMCKYFNVRIEWARKDTCLKHVRDSVAHKKNKKNAQEAKNSQGVSTSGVKRQVSLVEHMSRAKSAKTDKEEFVLSTVRAFVGANIPLEKVDHPKMREWMNKHIEGAGDLPVASRLRETYVPKLIEEEEVRVKEAVAGKRVCILCDETTDRKGQCVFIVLIKVLGCGDHTVQKLFVGGVRVLKNANATECSQAIVSVIQKLSIQYQNIVSITSDSARYMGKCINAIRILVSEDLVHTQCWAHKINLVANLWAIELKELNECVTETKHVFINTRKRKHAYTVFLQDKYTDAPENVKLFPMPVITRWNSWFRSVEYLSKHLPDVIEFVKSCHDDSAALQYFKDLTPTEILILQSQATFLVEHFSKCCNLLQLLESSSLPLALTLNTKLNDLFKLFSLLSDGFFFQATAEILETVPRKSRESLSSQFKAVARKCSDKLAALRETDTAKLFISAAGELFDPRNISITSVPSNISDLMKSIPIVKELTPNQYLEAYTIFRDTVKSVAEHGEDTDIIHILLSMKSDFSQFVECSIQALWIPVSNVDCERAFSLYGNIMTDKRTSITPENMELMAVLAFPSS